MKTCCVSLILLVCLSILDESSFVHGFIVPPASIIITQQVQQQHVTTLALQSTTTTIVERMEFEDNFNRWKFMQNLLDEEVEAEDANSVLFFLLDHYSKSDIEFDDPNGGAGPEKTDAVMEIIDKVLSFEDNNNNKGSLPALQEPDCSPGDDALLAELKKLLPDPVENEDVYKGTWETIKELHGRTAVQMNEKEARPAWEAVCLIARLMINFGFITGDGLGIID